MSANATGRRSRVVAIAVASHHHGNTRKVAETMARALEADLWSAETADPQRLAEYDLIGLGSGIYFGVPHRSLRRLVASMPATEKEVFLFSTAGLWFLRRSDIVVLEDLFQHEIYASIGERQLKEIA